MHGHLHLSYQRQVDLGGGPIEVTGLDCDGDALVQRRCSGGGDLTEVPVNLSECAGPPHRYGVSCGRPWHPDDSSHRNDNRRPFT
jgi:hypothetical protein